MMNDANEEQGQAFVACKAWRWPASADWAWQSEHDCTEAHCLCRGDLCWGRDANCEPTSPGELRRRIDELTRERDDYATPADAARDFGWEGLYDG